MVETLRLLILNTKDELATFEADIYDFVHKCEFGTIPNFFLFFSSSIK